MFGFIAKAAKATVGAVASVVKNPVVSSVVKVAAVAVPGAAPIVAGASLVANAMPVVKPSAPAAQKQAVVVAAARGMLPPKAIPPGGDKWLAPAAIARQAVVAAQGRDPKKRAAAIVTLKATQLRARSGDPAAKRALAFAKAAYSEQKFGASGRVKVAGFWLYRDGSIQPA